MHDLKERKYSIDELELLEERIRRAIELDDDSSPVTGAVRRPTFLTPRKFALACLLLVTCAAAISLTGGFGGGHSESSDINARVPADRPVTLEPLSKHVAISFLAKNAATGGLPFALPNQFFHAQWERSVRAGGTASIGPLDDQKIIKYKETRTETEDRWVSLDRSGASQTDVKSIDYPTDYDRRIAAELGPSELGTQVASYSAMRFVYLGGRSFSREELLDYKPDPDQLIKDLTNRPVVDYRGDAAGIWASLVESMTSFPMPLHIRATMIRALGKIPNVKIAGARRDRLGRQGYAFELEYDGVRDELLLEPKTAQVLHMRRVVLRPRKSDKGATPGMTELDQLLTRYELVDDLPTEIKQSGALDGQMPQAAIRQEARLAAEASRRDRIAIERRAKQADR